MFVSINNTIKGENELMDIFEEGNFYHIYNRGANRENIFFERGDYDVFLEKYIYYLYPAMETLSWCLMKNHFHALIRIRTETEQVFLYKKMADSFKTSRFHGEISPEIKPYNAPRQLAHFMNSYTRFVNRRLNRKGTLVEGPLKRKNITDESYLAHLICYIHRNPIHHGLTENYSDYTYSSYTDFINGSSSFTAKNKVMDLFGGIENFVDAHEEFKLKNESKLESNFYLE